MQEGHPESLLLNGVVAQLVVEGISFPLRVEVDVEVLVDVGHVERLTYSHTILGWNTNMMHQVINLPWRQAIAISKPKTLSKWEGNVYFKCQAFLYL